jgi:hypothetical protein
MAAVFPNIMTAFLARPEIAAYFKAIERRRVDVPRWTGRWPLLAVWVVNNVAHDDAGDAREMRRASYAAVAAARLESGEYQDALIGEMTDLIEAAAKAFTYRQVAGWSAQVRVSAWDSDDNTGDKGGSLVWVDIPLEIRFKPA